MAELDKELVEGKEAIDVVEETQEYKREKTLDEIRVGDRVTHSRLYISICRGNARKKAEKADYEVIDVTPRSITVRPWGTDKKYGSRFDRRYIKKA